MIHFGKYLPKTSTTHIIVTDSTVGPLHANALAKDINAKIVTIPSGEHFKTRATKEWIEDELFKLNADKHTTLIGMGGGVVTDITGFVAATYQRGIPLVLIPTTLLAMVDAAIGGKNGVNTPHGKNMIGTIYQPIVTVIDTSYLETLPQNEYQEGFAETIKAALICDKDFFLWLEEHASLLQKREPNTLLEAIKKSIAIKQSVVEKDERELGLRHILNFGHTVAHAIETLSNYEISHGRAVAIGMIEEAKLSGLSMEDITRIDLLLKHFELVVEMPYTMQELFSVMCKDKKAKAGVPRFVALSAIGKVAENFGKSLLKKLQL